MSKPPSNEYHRRALSALATHIAAERDAQAAIDKARGEPCPLCPKPALNQRQGFARIETRAGCGGNCNQGRADCECVRSAQMPAPHFKPLPAITCSRTPLRKRIAFRLQLLREWLVDPVIHG